MTASQAFDLIHKTAETVGIKEPGICTVARVQIQFPEYEGLNCLLLVGGISPDEYAFRCISLINEFARQRMKRRTTQLLLEVENEHSLSQE